MRFLNVDIKDVTEKELLQQLRRGVLITPNVDQMVKLQKDRENINRKVGREIVVGAYSPSYGFEKKQEENEAIYRMINDSGANVVYQLVHLYRHVFENGLGLRQLMDCYFALRVWHDDVMESKDLQTQGRWNEGLGTPVMSKTEVMAVLRSFGMGKFAGAVMFVLNEVFAIPTRHSINDERLMIIRKLIKLKQVLHTLSIKRGVHQATQVHDCPWLLCEPNEVEGSKLLEEIMQGGNFGQYDTRDAGLKRGGMVKHGVWKLKRVMRLVSSYPEEALWEPVFRVYHLLWRGING